MPEKLQEQSIEDNERQSLLERYKELNETRRAIEDDARQISAMLEQECSGGFPCGEKGDKLRRYFELDEATVAGIEAEMIKDERKLDYKPNQSMRYDEMNNDILVNSALLYHERMDRIKEASGDKDVDKKFINAVIDYASAVEHDSNSIFASRYDDISVKQEYIQNCQRRRSNCHNDMIVRMNEVNDLARDCGVKPLMYRNLRTNSSANNYKNDTQMYHDRVSLVRYVSKMIDFNRDDQALPETKYVKET